MTPPAPEIGCPPPSNISERLTAGRAPFGQKRGPARSATLTKGVSACARPVEPPAPDATTRALAPTVCRAVRRLKRDGFFAGSITRDLSSSTLPGVAHFRTTLYAGKARQFLEAVLSFPEKGGDVPAQSRQLVYASGEWEVDLARRELRARGVPVPIGGRAFEIVEVLVRSAGEIVTKTDLMGRVWPRAALEDNTLQFHISAIRKAFGPDRGMLKTTSGRGYRLLGAWTVPRHGPPT